MLVTLNLKLKYGVLFLKIWWHGGILHRQWFKRQNNFLNITLETVTLRHMRKVI